MSQTQVLSGLVLSASSEEESVSCLYPAFWGLPAILGAPCLGDASLWPPALSSHGPSLCVSLFPMRRLIIGLRGHSKSRINLSQGP